MALTAFFWLIVLTGRGWAQSLEQAVELDPRLDWQVLRSPHFEIVYSPVEEPWAREVASIAEDVYGRLKTLLGTEPPAPIRIVLTANHEISNGFSIPFPYAQVQIFLSAPRPGTVLGDTGDDWLRLLLTHELTHTFHLEEVRGFSWFLRLLFGRAPGLGTWETLAPMWLIEGMATYSETRNTGTGRIGSSLSRAILRQAALAGKFEPIDRVTTFDPVYPDGYGPYLWGGHFVDYLARTYGEEKLGEWIHDYALGPLPYSVDWSARNVFGKSFPSLWEDWQAVVEDEARAESARIEAEGERAGKVLLEANGWITTPRYTPDGKIVFWRASHDDFKDLYLINPDTAELSTADTNLKATSILFTPDGHAIGNGTRKDGPFSRYDVLVAGAWPDGPFAPLPGTEHGREAALSSDGDTLVFVRRNGPHTYLAKASLKDVEGSITPLTLPDERTDYADPAWIIGPDGKQEIVASVFSNRERKLWRLDPSSGRRLGSLIVPAAPGNEIQPMVSADGRLLAYASDRTGIYNIYVRELSSGTEIQLTNVVGAALEPTFSPDGRALVFVSWEADGQALRLIEVPTAISTGPGGTLEKEKTPTTTSIQPETSAETPQEASTTDITGPSFYHPWITLIPRFWMPQVAVASNDTLLGAWTANQDLLRHWFYSVSAFYGLTSEAPRVFASGGYSRLPAPWLDNPLVFASYSRDLGSFGRAYLTALNRYEDIFDQRDSIRVGLSSGSPLSIGLVPLDVEPENGFHYAAGAEYERRGDADGNLILLAIQQGITGTRLQQFAGSETTGFFGQIGYTWIRATPKAISRELGVQVFVDGNSYHKQLGGDFSGAIISGDLRVFLPVPFLPHNVIALRGAGGTTVGDRPLTPAFVLGGSLGEGLLTLRTSRLSLLRGYAESEFAGDHFVAGNAEYRLPLLRVRRGLWNLPLYLQDIHLSGFADIGEAWADGQDPTGDDLAVGVGGEVSFNCTLGYYLPTSLRVGVGHGLRLPEGRTEFYVQIGRSF